MGNGPIDPDSDSKPWWKWVLWVAVFATGWYLLMRMLGMFGYG